MKQLLIKIKDDDLFFAFKAIQAEMQKKKNIAYMRYEEVLRKLIVHYLQGELHNES